MTKTLILALILAASNTAIARAQTVTQELPTTVDVLVLAPVGDPNTLVAIGTKTTLIGAITNNCNLAPPTGTVPSPLVNPTFAYFDDPFHVGKFCRADMPTGLPDGQGYRAVAIAVAASCKPDGQTLVTPCPSLRSSVGVPPFDIRSIQKAPAVLTGLAVRP